MLPAMGPPCSLRPKPAETTAGLDEYADRADHVAHGVRRFPMPSADPMVQDVRLGGMDVSASACVRLRFPSPPDGTGPYSRLFDSPPGSVGTWRVSGQVR
jgi:hypothetical protein